MSRPCIPPPPRESGVQAIPPERSAELLADWETAERFDTVPCPPPTEEVPPCSV